MLHIYRQIRALKGFQPVVLCQKRENTERFPMDDVLVLPKPRTHQLRRLWQKQILGRPITIYRSEARRIAQALQERHAQVLHIYFGHIGTHLLPLIEISPIPVIVSFHGADAGVDLQRPSHLAATRRMVEKADRILVRSESLAERVRALGCPPEKLRLHRTGLPLEEIPFRQRSAPADGAWRCVQACRLIAKKGIPCTLHAFRDFRGRYPKATLTIAGEGPMLEDLRTLAGSLGIGDAVFFTGFLSQEKLRDLFAESHLFLHPSETGPDGDQEGVPNSMLEAMAGGLPVLATKHGGIPEAVENGVSGVLVEERDHATLGAEMIALAGHPERYAKMSVAAATRARTQFDLRVQNEVLEGIYRECIEESPRSANR